MAIPVAIVTGADTGIGRAIAERLLRDGYALGASTHSDDEDATRAIEELRVHGTVHWVVADLADAEAPARIVRETVEALGGVDVLVNNAGVTVAGKALELGVEEFDKIFAVDVRAAFLLSREVTGHMEDGGSIVNVTSVHEHVPRPGFALYAAAKAALGMLTRGLALEWAGRKIRVNAVAPGLIATPRNADDAEELAGKVPLGRAGKPEEVAALVAFLVSDEAAYISGASYLIDGAAAQAPLQTPAW